MSRQFSSATVLRMVPNSLLAQFFERLGLGDLDIAWDKLGQREITQAHKAISLLSRPEQDAVIAQCKQFGSPRILNLQFASFD
jgi:hypothetical protein